MLSSPTAVIPYQLENVGHIFATEKIETHALRHITCQMSAGDYVAITGPSGCGKSTLLSMLGLLNTPSSGLLRVFGRDSRRLTATQRARLRREHIGFVLQNFQLLGDLSITDNVALPLRYAGVTRSRRTERAVERLETMGLGARLDHFPSQLSGGQQQRVAIARALINDPDVLLADEPTGNLDSENTNAVMDLLEKQVERGKTLILVTHDLSIAARARTRIALAAGQIATSTSAQSVAATDGVVV